MSDLKPLTGRRIVVTRPAGQSADWRARLEALGAQVIELPLIQVSKDVNLDTLAEVLTEFGSYEWIIFTSANGVKYFFEEFIRVHADLRALGLIRIAVVGEATATAVRELHLRVDLQPGKSSGEELAKTLTEREAMDSAKVLVITGKGARGSDDGGGRGVLKRVVPQWLGLPEFRSLVLGFESAAIGHGGEGALYVSLRKAR